MFYITPDSILDQRFGPLPRPAWKTAILCFRGYRHSQRFVMQSGAAPLQTPLMRGLDTSPDEDRVYELDFEGERVGVITCCLWGGPQTAILVEDLACLGVQHLIGWGCGGSLLSELPKGSGILASSGLNTDGTSRAYTPESHSYPDAELLTRAARIAPEFKPVTIVTTDAVYRETPELAEEWRRQGAHLVNMDTSPFYAACSACHVKGLYVGYVTDCLGKEWEDWFSPLDEAEDASINLCMDLARILSQECC